MQLATPDLAHEAGAAARDAFNRGGGVMLARLAEADPGLRSREVRRLLDSLGVLDLRPREELEELAAAGEVCRAAGAVALPYPLVGSLSAPAGRPGLVVLGAGGRLGDHADLLAGGVVAVLGGSAREILSARLTSPGRLAPFVAELDLGAELGDAAAAADVALWLTLSGWWILGAAEAALQLAVKHVNEREQFGAPLAKLQSVRFRIADAAVLTRGLAELARYTTWALARRPQDALVDSLALRVTAQEAALATFRTSHQLHGATGFCDEHDLSILSRHVQPYLRLPLDLERSSALLAKQIDSDGFEGLFGRHN